MRLLLLSLLLVGCAPRTAAVPDAAVPDAPPADVDIVAAEGTSTEHRAEGDVKTGNIDFAGDLYRELAAENPAGNLFFSPTSVSVALGMTWAGASGQTRADMAKALRFPDDDDRVHGELSGMLASWNADEERPFELSVANHLWAQTGFDFEDDYMALVDAHYAAGLERLDLQNKPEPSRARINGWVSEQTRERIPELLPAGVLTPNSVLVLTNAVYFLGSWKVEFDQANTETAPFQTLAGTPVDAELMVQKSRFLYAERDGVQVLSLPYEGDRLSMVALLPAEGELEALEASLGGETITSLVGSVRPVQVRAWLPKFELDAEYDLVPTLKKLGMGVAFSEQADFGRMSSEPLQISDVIHKSFVKVNEEGTEAAAATAVIIATRSATPRPVEVPEFRADRPFVFLIWDRETETPLFVGRIADPS
ncbi:MAG: serpin family protein [Proteobacteria bacterium]|nr:serpin family protein [Pseudomonadota bacterium]